MGNTPSKSDGGYEPPKTTLFEKEPSGVTYRIPALVYLRRSGTFLAFAEKRTSSRDSDAKVLVMRRGLQRDDGSVQWLSSEELPMACLPNHRTMNPCPVFEKNTRTLFLFFVCILGHTSENRQIITGKNKTRLCYISSGDDGHTWNEAEDVTQSVIGETIHKWATFAVGPGHGVQLENGSTDFGKTWHMGKMLHKRSCECEMAEIIDHEGRSHLYCNARNFGGYRREALSENSGVFFDKPRMARELVEQPRGCQGSVIGFPPPEFIPSEDAESKASDTSPLSPDTQTWLLFMHPTSKHCRRDMGVYLNRSPLHSRGWDRPWIIHSGPSGYSDLAYNRENDQFSCLMECGKESELEQIAFMSFTLKEVMQTNRKTC
ncbi:sialidase-3-like isoform X2 [Syngnathoides biaculeatus]|uniref:sialidase-3-like isoform X2 n=1 Tax=Syngnathoides biaculeatus TaxID=300417 RepID=UPI002ADDAF23|nr:sialidase-3-like isoform X2 [Syngnathoides biaculeatus]